MDVGWVGPDYGSQQSRRLTLDKTNGGDRPDHASLDIGGKDHIQGLRGRGARVNRGQGVGHRVRLGKA